MLNLCCRLLGLFVEFWVELVNRQNTTLASENPLGIIRDVLFFVNIIRKRKCNLICRMSSELYLEGEMLASVLSSLASFKKCLLDLCEVTTKTSTTLGFCDFMELILFGSAICLHDASSNTAELRTIVDAILKEITTTKHELNLQQDSTQPAGSAERAEHDSVVHQLEVANWQASEQIISEEPKLKLITCGNVPKSPHGNTANIRTGFTDMKARHRQRVAAETLRNALDDAELEFMSHQGDFKRTFSSQHLVPSRLNRRVPEPISRVRWNDFYTYPDKVVGRPATVDKTIDSKRKQFYKHLAGVYPFRPRLQSSQGTRKSK